MYIYIFFESYSLINRGDKINSVTHYFSIENSSVGEQPVPKGRTHPDGRKITIFKPVSKFGTIKYGVKMGNKGFKFK